MLLPISLVYLPVWFSRNLVATGLICMGLGLTLRPTEPLSGGERSGITQSAPEGTTTLVLVSR